MCLDTKNILHGSDTIQSQSWYSNNTNIMLSPRFYTHHMSKQDVVEKAYGLDLRLKEGTRQAVNSTEFLCSWYTKNADLGLPAHPIVLQ